LDKIKDKNKDKSKDKSKREVIRMANKYQCTICGYIYDPEKGDPDSGVAPNTPFEALPETWTCPQCGSAKDSFKELI
jgi:rubredoxin